MSESKKIVLKSSDDETFEVDEAVAREFQIVAHMIEDGCAGKPIPLSNVTGPILSKVIEYCRKHVEAGAKVEEDEEAKKELDKWDADFLKGMDFDTMFPLVLAANYLNVKGLLDLVCQSIADYIQDKKVEEVREIFKIENDYTPEEEEAVRKENAWAFEN
ncbi:hypothetical protein EUTSA_v10005053mg [Eutrema salsugineum]|uniref:SKP1-like protein n=1 Tax=Eutrema salsugineum TaxID=72664 RepID=V4MNB2_EUTSA|nr:SKP1-like protein 18 [Eutrema salsugineum]ESQ33021.1 hypothetical protein EUTSA_v10005053mg [Eutrema salsugineum]